MSFFGFTNRDPGYEMHSQLPNLRPLICEIPGNGIGIGFDPKTRSVFRFSTEEEIARDQAALIVIRDANGAYADPASYLDALNQTDKKALATGLRRCGGLSVARIEKYLNKKEAAEARRPLANGNVVLRLQMA